MSTESLLLLLLLFRTHQQAELTHATLPQSSSQHHHLLLLFYLPSDNYRCIQLILYSIASLVLGLGLACKQIVIPFLHKPA